jgi:quercetin dioxygenase-like cupin family protein
MVAKDELPRMIAKEEIPFGKIAHKFEGHRHGGVDASFFLVECPPSGGPVLHTHPYEGVFVTLEGEATFIVGGANTEAGACRIVVAPAGVPHRFVNSGAGPLRQVDIPEDARPPNDPRTGIPPPLRCPASTVGPNSVRHNQKPKSKARSTMESQATGGIGVA